MSILTHPIFKDLEIYFDIQIYDKDGSTTDPRIRIELMELPTDLHKKAVETIMPCVACGREMHPIRERAGKSGRGHSAQNLYYAATCPLEVNMGCARGKKARDEYRRVKGHFHPELLDAPVEVLTRPAASK